MKVDDILKAKGRAVSTTSPDTAVIRVVERMRLERIGALVVSNDGKRVEGVITERDIVSRDRRSRCRCAELAVPGRDDPIGANVLTRRPRPRRHGGDDRHRRVRHLPWSSSGQLLGIVSIGDVVKSCLEDADLEVRVLRDAYLGHR